MRRWFFPKRITTKPRWAPLIPKIVGQMKADGDEELSAKGPSKSLFLTRLNLSTHVYSCLPLSKGGRPFTVLAVAAGVGNAHAKGGGFGH